MPLTERAPGDGEKDAQTLLRDRITASAERVSGHYKMLRKFWRYYLTTSDRGGTRRHENDRDPGAGIDWRANLFVPATFSVVETAVPRIVFALFGKRPYVKVMGRERSDAENAAAVEAMLDYDLEQSGVLQMAIDFFKSFYIFGTAVCRVDYHRDFYYIKKPPEWTFDIEVDDNGNITGAKEKRLPNKELVPRYDGPRAIPTSLFDFFPDPQFSTIPEMRYVAERVETTISKLRQENKLYKAIEGKNLYKNLDEIKVHRDGKMSDFAVSEDMRQDTTEIMEFGESYMGRRQETKDDDLVVTYRYWEDDRYTVLANGTTIIRDGENPYNDKRKPFVAAQCFPLIKEFYGQGLLQEELNTLRNIALDQGKLNMYGVWAVEESLTLTDADLAIYPGKVIPAEFGVGGKPNIAKIFDSTLPNDYERLESRVQKDIQSALAINDYMIGAGSGSAGTASEAAMLNASAANRFRLQALIAQERFIETLSDMFISRRQQFLHKPMQFRVLGEQGINYPTISPEDIWGRFDFEPQGSQSQPNKEVLRQQMVQLLSVAAGNPVTMQMTNWPEAYKELWNMFDFRHPERFILPPAHKQIGQKEENMIIMQGAKVAVEPNEPHDQHLQELMGILPDVVQAGDERVLEAYEDHYQQHQGYIEAAQGAPKQGQQPGQTTGVPGNQPNFENQQVPTIPALQSKVMGGPGGPVA
jgi:hypothetical protein